MEVETEGGDKKKQREEESDKEAADERGKRNLDEDRDEDRNERNWKKKKLNWLKSISKIPGVVPIGRVQVVEVYSPERVTKVVKEKGLEVGLSMDLLTGWDFDKTED